MSINLLLEEPESPVIWRGPILANTVKQFWTDIIWGDIDFMFLDMPPGTGDVPLTVFQSIPLSGIIIVTSPQDLVSMIVKKAVNMANMMNIPILGLVENMSYAVCPHCGETIKIFGESTSEKIAKKWNIPFLGSLPIDPDLSRLCDEGHLERIHKAYLSDAIVALEKIPASKDPFVEEVHMKTDSYIKKVAIASEGSAVCEHFGHCEGFTLYSIDNGKSYQSRLYQKSWPQAWLELPNLLNDNGVHVVIAGGMGAGAIEIFDEKDIDVITGARGQLDQTIAKYLGRFITVNWICLP